MQKGDIQQAYQHLMGFIQSLKTRLQKNHPEYGVSNNLYFGYMDMTYFALAPQDLAGRGLKIALVFLHADFRFEIWLAAANKNIQKEYWRLFKENGWNKSRLIPDYRKADSILETIAAAEPDFEDPDALSCQIEEKISEFLNEIREYLSTHGSEDQ